MAAVPEMGVETFDFSQLELVVRGPLGPYASETEAYGPPADLGEEDDEFAVEVEPWLKRYLAEIKMKTTGERIGRLGYRIIGKAARRVTASLGGRGWNNLASRLADSEDGGMMLQVFGRDLFYNNPSHNPQEGGLKDELISGERRGTGVFGKEINQGNIAFFSNDEEYKRDDFVIQGAYRRQGIGLWAMIKILEHESLARVNFAFVLPWPSGKRNPTPDEFARIENFYRRAGFRRVGQSEYFAYAFDPEHPSRRLSIKDDMEVPYVSPKPTQKLSVWDFF